MTTATTALARAVATCLLTLPVLTSLALGQVIRSKAVDKWLTVTASAAGTGAGAKDDAVARALRKAVEQACGVFLTAESKTRDYKLIYDKIFADSVGYVREYKVVRTWQHGGATFVKVSARVSTQKFRKDWAVIAHTVHQEGNPRVILAVPEAISTTAAAPRRPGREGVVNNIMEDFFLDKGIQLMDRATATTVSKRDILLASFKDDTNAVAALGARFKADVVITGQAEARFGKTLTLAGQTFYQFVATINVRVIQTDSARVLASKSYETTSNSLQRGGGGRKALRKLAKQCAPKLLAAVVHAWRRRANVSRSVELGISGMTFKTWKAFQAELKKVHGIQNVRLREITEAVASISVESEYNHERLADKLVALKDTKVEVTEITANRIKLKVLADQEDQQ